MMTNSTALFVAVVFGMLYHYWGKEEYGSGTTMAALSGGVSGLAIFMGWRVFGVFVGQILLGVLFFAYHMSRPMKKHI